MIQKKTNRSIQKHSVVIVFFLSSLFLYCDTNLRISHGLSKIYYSYFMFILSYYDCDQFCKELEELIADCLKLEIFNLDDSLFNLNFDYEQINNYRLPFSFLNLVWNPDNLRNWVTSSKKMPSETTQIKIVLISTPSFKNLIKISYLVHLACTFFQKHILRRSARWISRSSESKSSNQLPTKNREILDK